MEINIIKLLRAFGFLILSMHYFLVQTSYIHAMVTNTVTFSRYCN